MPDNRDMRGGRDSGRVSAEQEHDVRYLAEKYKVSADEVKRAIAEVGNDRVKVERYLSKSR